MSLSDIKIFISDVDGVMTDARIWLNTDDEWCRQFSIYDGMGLKRLQAAGIKTGIITASIAHDVRTRFKFLKVDYFHEGAKDKLVNLEQILNEAKLEPSQVCYIGDDLMDLPVIEKVGYGVTVPHALQVIKDKSDYTTKAQGGFGAVREICEMILEATQSQEARL